MKLIFNKSALGIIGCIIVLSSCEQKRSNFKMEPLPATLEIKKTTDIGDEDKLILVRWQIRQQDWTSAIDLLNQVAIRNADYFFLKSQISSHDGEIREAFQWLLRAQTLEPDRLDIAKYALDLSMQLADKKHIQKNMAIISNHQPKYAKILMGEAFVFLLDGEIDTAAALLSQIEFVEEQDKKVQLMMLQEVAEKRGDRQELLAILKRRIALEKENQDLKLNSLTLLFQLKQNEEAINAYNEYSRYHSSVSFQIELMRILQNFEYYKLLSEKLEELLGQESQQLDLLFFAARFYDQRYQYPKSAELYQKILKIDESNEIAQTELANVNRKIAYLRRQKELEEERQRLPVLEQIKSIEL